MTMAFLPHSGPWFASEPICMQCQIPTGGGRKSSALAVAGESCDRAGDAIDADGVGERPADRASLQEGGTRAFTCRACTCIIDSSANVAKHVPVRIYVRVWTDLAVLVSWVTLKGAWRMRMPKAHWDLASAQQRPCAWKLLQYQSWPLRQPLLLLLPWWQLWDCWHQRVR